MESEYGNKPTSGIKWKLGTSMRGITVRYAGVEGEEQEIDPKNRKNTNGSNTKSQGKTEGEGHQT